MANVPAAPPAQSLTLGDLTINRLGYGAMHLTGPGMWGPPHDPDNAVAVLRRAIELGVTFVDTADSYGPGDNERIIRQALHPYPDHLVICTKGGMLRSGPTDWVRSDTRPPYIVPCGRPAYLRQQVELSLRNLGTDRIDLYELHSIDPLVPLEDQLGELVTLQEQGKIRYIGISGQPKVTVDQLAQARGTAEIVAVENLFNIADVSGQDALAYAEQHQIAFIPWFPLGHGDLLRPGSALNLAADKHGVTAAQLGIAWLLRRSPAMLPIPGTSSIAHLAENMRATEIELADSDWAVIEKACAQEPVWRPGT
jgi:aryl-alcohol dehydrogenase-like predicted oxidoreductase